MGGERPGNTGGVRWSGHSRAKGDHVFHMGWFLGNGFGIKPWRGSPWVGQMAHEWMKPDIYRDMATSLERAGFDYILVEDTCMIEDVYGGSMKTTLNHGILAPKNDPCRLSR
jgi:long-chain alkane monooxygenase